MTVCRTWIPSQIIKGLETKGQEELKGETAVPEGGEALAGERKGSWTRHAELHTPAGAAGVSLELLVNETVCLFWACREDENAIVVPIWVFF